ncbi:Charged multivesicular body protein 6 [Teratosphaeria destructans]|uniref:Charged multivesicular body protein 6 n=1 Tax=Teratosphaeria destructans TaxID=418781 RepID=A0A9W7VXZ3_9PEZI|nr:Charged multivesicular body protein 6 [Teratosphaeria destructans]
MGNTTSHPKVSARDRAILDMKVQRDKLKQYQKRIQVVTDRETAIARDCVRVGDKARALLALRRKKYQQSLLQRSDRQLEQLQALTADLEFALVQKDVLFGLQQAPASCATSTPRWARRGGGAHEITNLLAGKMSNAEEDEVEDELEAMERELDPRPVSTLPDAPAHLLLGDGASLPEVPRETPEEKERRRRKERAARFEARNTRQPVAA